MQFVPGDLVRLIKAAPVRNSPGPPIGTVGTLLARELGSAPSGPPIWRVEFKDFTEQFYAECLPGIWFVHSDEIELIRQQASPACLNSDATSSAILENVAPALRAGV